MVNGTRHQLVSLNPRGNVRQPLVCFQAFVFLAQEQTMQETSTSHNQEGSVNTGNTASHIP